MGKLIAEGVTRSIIGGFYEVHHRLGFGFFESVYLIALDHELVLRGHLVTREFAIIVRYREVVAGRHRLDMVVDDTVVIEVNRPPSCIGPVFASYTATSGRARYPLACFFTSAPPLDSTEWCTNSDPLADEPFPPSSASSVTLS
jgi:hypothetical protein